MAHADEPALRDLQDTTIGVAEPGVAGEQPLSDVQLLAVRDDLRARPPEPGPTRAPERHRQPVGDIHQALVHHQPTRHLGGEFVVHPCHVRARRVNPVGDRLRSSTTTREVPIPQRAENLTLALLVGVEPLVGEPPRIGERRLPGGALTHRSGSGRTSPQRHRRRANHRRLHNHRTRQPRPGPRPQQLIRTAPTLGRQQRRAPIDGLPDPRNQRTRIRSVVGTITLQLVADTSGQLIADTGRRAVQLEASRRDLRDHRGVAAGAESGLVETLRRSPRVPE